MKSSSLQSRLFLPLSAFYHLYVHGISAQPQYFVYTLLLFNVTLMTPVMVLGVFIYLLTLLAMLLRFCERLELEEGSNWLLKVAADQL